mmetsp:Transcript_21453/g.47078  ORF Transcript_21453/g.47078 Transcript_21453/m.47078 type:complete len:237 (+) Transcript_21453:1503-2213(+)
MMRNLYQATQEWGHLRGVLRHLPVQQPQNLPVERHYRALKGLQLLDLLGQLHLLVVNVEHIPDPVSGNNVLDEQGGRTHSKLPNLLFLVLRELEKDPEQQVLRLRRGQDLGGALRDHQPLIFEGLAVCQELFGWVVDLDCPSCILPLFLSLLALQGSAFVLLGLPLALGPLVLLLCGLRTSLGLDGAGRRNNLSSPGLGRKGLIGHLPLLLLPRLLLIRRLGVSGLLVAALLFVAV